MKNYVINLERAVERKDATIKQFGHYGIEFEFFSGVDWQNLTNDDIINYVHPKYISNSKKYKRPLVHGTLACWLSHRRLWQIAVNQGEDMVAVFEDDATLTEDTSIALNAIENMGKSTDGFQFDVIFLYNGRDRNPIFPIYKVDEKFTLSLVKYDSIGAVGYVITHRAMKTLLEQFPLMIIHVDALMHSYYLHGLKTYVLSPQVVFHGEGAELHHSYNAEATSENQIIENCLSDHTYHRRRSLRHSAYRLLNHKIPRMRAFRHRMKNETNHFS